MRVRDLFEAHPDAEHFDALDRTGFFGAAGAGCVFLAMDTGRLLIAHRSMHVEQPDTWGGWGGAINRGENPEEAVRREVAEEAGYHGHFEMEPLFVFAKGTFRYYNFLVIVDQEFTPTLDWETQGFEWCEWGHWPQPLHFGLISLFSDPASAAKIKAEISAIKGQPEVEESVSAVAGSPHTYPYNPSTLTAVQRFQAQTSGLQWHNEHPRGTELEASTMCPYQKNTGQFRIWMRAALGA